MLMFPSAVPHCSEFCMLYRAQVGMFPLSYLKPYGHQACQIIVRRLLSVRLSPSLSTLVT